MTSGSAYWQKLAIDTVGKSWYNTYGKSNYSKTLWLHKRHSAKYFRTPKGGTP